MLGYPGYKLHMEISELDETFSHSYLGTEVEMTDGNSDTRSGFDKRSAQHGQPVRKGEKAEPPALHPLNAEVSESETTSHAQTMEAGSLKAKGQETASPAAGSSDLAEAPLSRNDRENESSTQSSAAERKPAPLLEDEKDAGDISPRRGLTGSTQGGTELDSLSIDLPEDDENWSEHLKELSKISKNYSRDEIIRAIQAKGMQVAGHHPRDVAVFFCLHFLFVLETGHQPADSDTWAPLLGQQSLWPLVVTANQANENKGDNGTISATVRNNSIPRDKAADFKLSPRSKALLSLAKQCLLRSLAISNQGSAVGMTGWLEYGAGNSFGRMTNTAFVALGDLAHIYAASGDWHGAMDVLRCQVSRCDQHLPIYHPTTLSSILDLAGAAGMAAQPMVERNLIREVSTRFSFYLAEQEERCLSYALRSDATKAVFVHEGDIGVGAASMLQGFVEAFQTHFSRAFIRLVGYDAEGRPKHVLLVSHILSGDSLSVLANCFSSGEVHACESGRSHVYWRAAYRHYEAAFKGFLLHKHKLSDDEVVSAACGMARYLRALNRGEKASQILSSVVAALGREEAVVSSEPALERNYAQDDVIVRTSFLPTIRPTSTRLCLTQYNNQKENREQSMALCLWLMAILAVEDSPDERGRMRALSMLHAASEALQSIVSYSRDKTKPPTDQFNTASKIKALTYSQSCHALLLLIEEEAKELLTAVENAVADAAPRGCNKKNSYASVMV